MDNLEEKIDELVTLANDLKHENTVLRDRESDLMKERSLLLEKNDKARTRVERMIIRLKALNAEG
jgi:cell division protein ZapB